MSLVALADAAMATSGHRYTSSEVGGRRYSPIVDPRSADRIEMEKQLADLEDRLEGTLRDVSDAGTLWEELADA